MAANKQLERTVVRRRERAAFASFHCAHAARWTRGRAAVQLQRQATPDKVSLRVKANLSRRHLETAPFRVAR
jgi:hypothetical protein